MDFLSYVGEIMTSYTDKRVHLRINNKYSICFQDNQFTKIIGHKVTKYKVWGLLLDELQRDKENINEVLFIKMKPVVIFMHGVQYEVDTTTKIL